MKYEEGAVYYVKFLDHIKGHDKPLMCQVVGWVIEDNNDSVVLSWWEPEDMDIEMVKVNRELITIVKSTIKKKRKLFNE